MPLPRTTRRKALIGIGGAAATLAATAALAVAQALPNPPDGSPPAPLPASNVVTTVCGPTQTSIVKTETSPSITSAVNWVPLTGAATQVAVPDGQSRCIKVLLTAETACQVTAAPDFCYVRALVDGVPMDPDGAGFQAIDSEDGSASAHAYEWIKRVGDGAHIVRIERRVGNGATAFWADDWTFDVSLSL
jgi:hypothetical protein